MIRPIKTYLSKSHYQQSFKISLFSIALLFLISLIYWQDLGGMADFLPATNFLVFTKGEYYRALTTNLIHSNLKHLISNSYMLLFLGILIYNSFGFFLFPIISLAFSILVTLISLETYPENTILLGASGWVYLLGGCWCSLYVLLDTRISVFLRFFKAIAVSLIIFWPQTFLPEVSYRTHAIGFVVGIFSGIIYYLFKRNYLLSFEEFAPPEEINLDDPNDPEFFE